MGIELHLAERTDRLADDLGALLAKSLPDVFAEELVVVPAKGVERWLTQRLSHHLGVGRGRGDGVCAGVRFVNPRSLVALLTGTDRTDPWDPDRLVWPVLAAIDESLGEPWCAPLSRHLGEQLTGTDRDLRRDRRWSVARRIAGLFAAYAVQRPQLVDDWSAGRDDNGAGGSLDDDLAWQPGLWRRVAERVGAPTPPERHRDTLARIRAGDRLALPDRLSLFGHTRLPVTEIELLRAVGHVREVHVWLPTASPALWSRLWRLTGTADASPIPRAEDRRSGEVEHPLLLSLGRDSRELSRSLGALRPAAVHVADPVAATATLLGWLQSDIRANREPTGLIRQNRLVAPDDLSVQVHATHGTARQVEVLREVLAGLLQDDPTLQPRDVLVMCPDIETYAPLVQAGFGLLGVVPDGHPAHRLRVQLADRGPAATNPFLSLAAQLIGLAGSRATLTEVLDLAATPPVRHRFGFGDDDLTTMAGWAGQAGVRWGLNESLRTAYRLQGFPQNTWRAGLDRLLVGVAMSEGEALVGEVLPLDDVPSASVDVAGRFAELLARLESCVESLTAATRLDEWLRELQDGVNSLGSAAAQDAWQVVQFERELAAVAADARAAESDGDPVMRRADLRAVLEQRTGGRPTRANFRTGSLTVCTMVPMRSVPHRVVCLVGLDDGVFPRTVSVNGDDVLARTPLTGERDARSEDRQLLLDAVLAATEHLVITYTGADEHTGQTRPPAVPVGELLDALDLTARTTTGPVRAQVVTRHPLQPYDPRNLTAGALRGTGPFSFDRGALAGATAAAGPRSPRPPFLPGPLPAAAPQEEVTLEELRAFFAHPVRAFLRSRLDVAVSADLAEPDDAMPVELDALARWGIGDRILRRLIEGDPAEAVLDAELRRGDLPPAGLGDRVLGDVTAKAGALLAAAGDLLALPKRTVDVSVDLGRGRRLTGAVGDIRGEQVVRVSYSSLRSKHRMAAWVDLLALCAAHPDTEWTACALGWHSSQRSPQRSALVVAPGDARALLLDLVDVYDRGMSQPLPLPINSAHAWCEASRQGNPPDRAARRAWETTDGAVVPGEQEDREHVLVYGPRADFAAVAGTPAADENWNDEQTRLGRYAVRVWGPLMEHERLRRL
ncbi:MAG TPA: exodeoxyribonuclease V subunit gamma [Dermatophilaceae bacterium]|nr:exodeoxyribonuclease V subunit gamma [Dermatophilaceae bacterium]